MLHNDSLSLRIITRRLEQCIYDGHAECVKLTLESDVPVVEAFQVCCFGDVLCVETGETVQTVQQHPTHLPKGPY